MNIFFYVIGFLFSLLILWVSYKFNSFPAGYFGLFILLILGLAAFNFGVDYPTGTEITYNDTGDVNAALDIFTNYTPANNWVISMFAWLFLLFPIGTIILTTLLGIEVGD